MIVGPLGDVLAGPLWDEAGILVAEIDLDEIARAKFDFDPVGHYSRPVSCVAHVRPFGNVSSFVSKGIGALAWGPDAQDADSHFLFVTIWVIPTLGHLPAAGEQQPVQRVLVLLSDVVDLH